MQEFLQQVKNSLAQNQNLEETDKEQIFSMLQVIYDSMQIFYDKTQEQHIVSMPTELLIERLKTISFQKGSELLTKEVYEYRMNENSVYIREKEIMSYAQDNILCQVLLEMAYVREPHKVTKGIDGQEFYAIKKGILEIFANNIVPNNSEKIFAEDEQIVVNLMDIINNGRVLESFLQADNKKLKDCLFNVPLTNANNLANYNSYYKNDHTTQLGNIEMHLIDAFFRQSKQIVNDTIEIFEANLFGQINILSKNYENVISVTDYFEAQKAKYYSGELNRVTPVYNGPSDLKIPEDYFHPLDNHFAEVVEQEERKLA